MSRFRYDQERGLILPGRAELRIGRPLLMSAPQQALMSYGAAVPAGDPYFANVVLLLLGIGTPGTAVATDSSSQGHTFTAFGDAQITATGPAGGQALLFDGTGDYFTCPHATSLDLTTETQWTVEAIYSHPAPQSGTGYMLTKWDSGGGVPSYGLNIGTSQFAGIAYLSNFSTMGGGSSVASPNNVFRHSAICRNGNDFTIADNGEVWRPSTSALNLVNFTPADLIIGSYNGSNRFLGSAIFRITKGVCRYPSTATLPTKDPYTVPTTFPSS